MVAMKFTKPFIWICEIWVLHVLLPGIEVRCDLLKAGCKQCVQPLGVTVPHVLGNLYFLFPEDRL